MFAGGAEVYIDELAKRWVKDGNSVTMFCGNDHKNLPYEKIGGIEVYRRGGTYMVYVYAFMYYMLKFRGKYDVIIDCENGIPFFTPLFVHKPVILLVHHVHQEVFRAFLRARADVAPLLPSTDMPNYPANALSDEMVKDLYAYIRSMPANRPETADIPVMRAILEAAERPYSP